MMLVYQRVIVSDDAKAPRLHQVLALDDNSCTGVKSLDADDLHPVSRLAHV